MTCEIDLDIDEFEGPELRQRKSYPPINTSSMEYKISQALYDKLVEEGRIVPLTEEQQNAHKIHRYQKPDVPHFGLSYPGLKSGAFRSRSRDKYGPMTEEQKNSFLESVGLAVSPAMALRAVGISTWRVLHQAFMDDPEFLDRYKFARAEAEGQLDRVIIDDALNGSVPSAITMRRFQEGMKARRADNKSKKRELDIRERGMKAKEKGVDGIVNAYQQSQYNRDLSIEEIRRYRELFSNLDSLTSDQKIEYFDLTSKLFPRQSSQVGTNGHAELNALQHVSHIESEFDEDEEDED